MSRTTRNSKKSQNKSNDKPSQIFIENTSLDSNSNLQQFLLNHLVKKGNPEKKNITNTRIGDKDGIMGGSYNIEDDEYLTFLELYDRAIIKKNKCEYLTEKQLDDGPLLVDLDFRYDLNIESRQHSVEHIEDLIDTYLCVFSEMFKMNANTNFKIFVMEKQNVNILKEKNITKDGIHILMTLNVDRASQLIIREKVIEEIKVQWEDLPIINQWNDVFDEGITKGHTAWQLYGSRKPKHDAYKVTNIYDINYDENDNELVREKIQIDNYKINIKELSVRNTNHIKIQIKDEYKQYHIQKKDSFQRKKNNSNDNLIVEDIYEEMNSNTIDITRIKSKEDIDFLYQRFIDGLGSEDFNIKETCNYTLALPEKYYGMGSYDKWIRVCWVLRNTSSKLLILWVKFSSQAPNFMCSFDELDELLTHWNNAKGRGSSGLTKRSLIHWVRNESEEVYKKIHRNTISYYIDRTIYGFDGNNDLKSERYEGGDVELAQVLYQIYKNDYVCTSIKGNIWYKFYNHRWVPNDSGTSLRKSISSEMRSFYTNKSVDLSKTLSEKIDSENLDETEIQKLTEKQKLIGRKIINIIQHLNKTTDKKNIMIEAKELFYDGDFMEKLDTNPYLLCFNNGVMDFKDKEFRDGRPDDYISLSTNINYVRLTERSKIIQQQIKQFFSELFPNSELREYMWEHLASTLLGTTDCQTFNMYIGKGQNGKSILVALMEQILGQYKGDVPLSLITNSRTKVGGVSPEIVQLRGIRLALMQEPKKGDIINEGIMKQLTSGEDNLQGRAPYMEKTLSFKPQLKLIVTSNVFMQINSNDHGTWRRIRVCPFESLFTNNPIKNDPDKPHQFKVDTTITKEKFPVWKEIFMSMLVEKVIHTKGLVKDCDIVLEHSKNYRASQDYISAFVQEKVIKHKNGIVEKNEINNEFKMWWCANYGQSKREPPAKEVHEYLDSNYGRCIDGHWKNIKVKYNRSLKSNSDIDDDDLDDINKNDL